MPTYNFRNQPLPGSNIRNIAGVNYAQPATRVLAIIGDIGAGATVERFDDVATTGTAGEYDITTVGTATSFIFYYAGIGQSLVPIP